MTSAGGRYDRQARVRGIGDAGQQRIGRATVLVVGVGALGTHSASTLARAGVGTLWLVDRDVVELSNLQRQVLFDERDARDGTPKAIAAARALSAVNSTIRIEPFVDQCGVEFLERLPAVPDLILDGTDNFATRYLLNDWSRKKGIPWIYAGAVAAEGAAMVIADGPCLRCLWPDAGASGSQPTCETAGALQPAIAAVTAFQCAEALKLLVGQRHARGIFTCDVLRGSYAVLGEGSERSPECAVCRGERWPALEADQGEPTATILCGRDAVQVEPRQRRPVDLDALAARLRGVASDVERTPHLLRFGADGARFSVFAGGRALLFGVGDLLRARALYDRWVGAD